jgi:glycosyltransferase involved in cell wall biosynthesis
MRATHISLVHTPLDNRIFEKECRDLARAGYDVHLLAGGAPEGRVDGVSLHSIDPDPSRPRARRQWRRLLRAARLAFKLRPSLYHLHDPHLIPLGLLLKLRGETVVYDVHEDYPAHARCKLFAHPARGRLKALMWMLLESLARRRFDGFVCASPTLAEKFSATSTVVMHNFPRRREFARAVVEPESRPYGERPNTLVCTGYIREYRCFWEIAQALELLPAELDCRLRMFGAFSPPGLFERARGLEAWGRMELIPWQRHSVVVRELFSAKVGMCLLHRLPNHGEPTRSNKLFEFMAAGLPVIASDMPGWRELVSGLGCGLVVDPRDPQAIANAIEQLLADPVEAEAMGMRGQAAVREKYNWEREAPRLLSLYGSLADPPAALPAGSPTAPRTAPAAAQQQEVLVSFEGRSRPS